MGNIDNSELISRNYFPEPVMARFVKFYPQKWITSIALRVELYGCPAGNNYKNYSCSLAGLSSRFNSPVALLFTPITNLLYFMGELYQLQASSLQHQESIKHTQL